MNVKDKGKYYKVSYYVTLVMLLLALGYIAFLFYSRNVLTDAIIKCGHEHKCVKGSFFSGYECIDCNSEEAQ